MDDGLIRRAGPGPESRRGRWPRQPPGARPPIHVRFASQHAYAVHFVAGVFDPAQPLLADCLAQREPGRCHRVLAVIDSGVAEAQPELPARIAAYADRYAGRFVLARAPLVIPGGEGCKNDPAILEALLKALHASRIDRHAFVLAIGGGALLDLAGFAAAVTHRGVRLIRVPTTVLAQNDAGIGVKNAINAFGCKNFLGTFQVPWAVINDITFIASLDHRDKIAGIAEAVKVALIRDRGFFLRLERDAAALAAGRPGALAAMIRRCAELHLDHVATSGDPFESGNARPLDHGHWAAHKLEALTAHGVRHGEAVAFGVALDACYAAAVGRIGQDDAERVCRLLERLGFRLWHPMAAATDAAGRRLILDGLADFREHLGGELTISLLTGIGGASDVHHVDEALVAACLDHLARRDAARPDGGDHGPRCG
jgi:3-dehydroquinate synthase